VIDFEGALVGSAVARWAPLRLGRDADDITVTLSEYKKFCPRVGDFGGAEAVE